MTTTNGTVLAISTVPLGDELATDALTGATSITIADAADFAETGGTLLINGQLTDYTAADDETGTVTLVDALVADASAGDRVDLADPSGSTATEWRALVAPIGNTDNDDAVDAAVAYPLIPLLAEGIRGPGTGESVTLTLDGSEWQLTNVHGRKPDIEPDNLGASVGLTASAHAETAPGVAASSGPDLTSLTIGQGPGGTYFLLDAGGVDLLVVGWYAVQVLGLYVGLAPGEMVRVSATATNAASIAGFGVGDASGAAVVTAASIPFYVADPSLTDVVVASQQYTGSTATVTLAVDLVRFA